MRCQIAGYRILSSRNHEVAYTVYPSVERET